MMERLIEWAFILKAQTEALLVFVASFIVVVNCHVSIFEVGSAALNTAFDLKGFHFDIP